MVDRLINPCNPLMRWPVASSDQPPQCVCSAYRRPKGKEHCDGNIQTPQNFMHACTRAIVAPNTKSPCPTQKPMRLGRSGFSNTVNRKPSAIT
jgi:hypothetical protein